ncbi:hypothetical protein GB928_018640 [Shinella curvata]|uniref:Uncharacterized protein n=1 Tax=Shinella curvata TaxID=1817964 RepID=A0ABT8XHJ2_9HYPH|nr:hypothetical protein [Shinella curvata]MCJ8053878.1 hypothetical protein [Shinella curvata]MDO6123210.1 hypothetical protein [Shinella curvata]
MKNGSDSAEGEAMSSQAKWNNAHPLEMLAHQYVRSALKKGLLNKEPCEVCGAENVDAHHDDYSRPGVVRWLCRLHHRHHHMQEKAV